MIEHKYKVYRYIFPNEKSYIGVTKNTISERRDQGYQHNSLLRNAISEYGWKRVQTEILESGLTQSEAFEAEKRYIAFFKSNIAEFGYNISKGGKATFAGLSHTKAHKKHMSNLYKGRTYTESTLQAFREGHAKERKAVIQFELNGEVIREFESLNDAANSINGFKTNISRACINQRPYKGYLWSFKGGGDR